MGTTKASNFTCQSKSFTHTFFTCQVSACELQPFSCHDSANDLYSQTAKTVFSHQRCDYIVFFKRHLLFPSHHWVVELSDDEHLWKASNFTCQSKSFTHTFFTCQVSACELQPFSCHDSANDLYSQTAKTVFSHQRCDYIVFFKRHLLFPSHHWVVELSDDEHLWKRLNVLEFSKLSSRVEEPAAPCALSWQLSM